jgi:hypothetical protein
MRSTYLADPSANLIAPMISTGFSGHGGGGGASGPFTKK